jgi:hypothetical protein
MNLDATILLPEHILLNFVLFCIAPLNLKLHLIKVGAEAQ